MTLAATQRRPDRDRFAAGGTNHMTDFDYGLAGRRTAWPVASPAEMFWPDILSPVSHLEGDREFADSPLEEDGLEPSVPAIGTTSARRPDPKAPGSPMGGRFRVGTDIPGLSWKR